MKKGNFLLNIILKIWTVAFESYLLSGVAFPTCISVNNCVGHFSPLKSEPPVTLKDGDLVKMYANRVWVKFQ